MSVEKTAERKYCMALAKEWLDERSDLRVADCDLETLVDLIAVAREQVVRRCLRLLDGVVERRMLQPAPDVIGPDFAAFGPAKIYTNAQSFAEAKQAATETWEREYLKNLMAECQGNISQAARRARCDRNHLRDRLKHHGIETDRR